MSDAVIDAMHRAAKEGPANAAPNMRRVLRAALEAAEKGIDDPEITQGARHISARDVILDRLRHAANISEGEGDDE